MIELNQYMPNENNRCKFYVEKMRNTLPFLQKMYNICYKKTESAPIHRKPNNEVKEFSMMERITITEQEIASAIENKEFEIYYQPKQDSITGKILGVEALARWIRPGIGMISPIDFIPVAEKTGLIILLGRWILETACRQNKTWQDSGYPPIVMGVNLSARQLYHKDLVEDVKNIIERVGIEPQYVELEITETMLMDVKHVLPIVQSLKDIGVRISLDDFGKGYSSLFFVKEFPIDTLKIDKSFIQNCTTDKKDASIVKTIIRMAHELEITVVAEGIETREQLIFLQENMCHQCQGFLFSKPLPPEDFECRYYAIEKVLLNEGIPQHVTREKWLEEELFKARRELVDTLRQQQGMIFKFVKKEDRFIHTLVNGELLYRAGLTPEAVIGKELKDFLPTLDALEKEIHYRKAWDGGEVLYEGKVGGLYYLASLRHIRKGGEIVEVIGSAVDITQRKKVEEKLEESEREHRLMVEWSPEAIIVHRDGIVLYANQASVELLGATSASDLVGKDILRFSTPEYIELVEERIKNLSSEGVVVPKTEEKVIRLDGKEIEIEVTGISLRYEGIPSYFMLIHDVSKKKEAYRAMVKSEERYNLIAENMTDLICLIDDDGTFKYASPSHVKILGYPSESYEGTKASMWMHEDDLRIVRASMSKMKETREETVVEFRFINSENNWVWLESKATPIISDDGEILHYLFVSREITERKQYEEKLTHLAYHDPLTALPNRRRLNDTLDETIRDSIENNKMFAVFFMDIDKFKKVNDRLGHDVGDELLKQFTRRIKTSLRSEDLIARYGGDEFTIIVNDAKSEFFALAVAERILATLQEPWDINGERFVTTSSVGIALFPNDGKTRRELLKGADIALYRAKENGRNTIERFGGEELL